MFVIKNKHHDTLNTKYDSVDLENESYGKIEEVYYNINYIDPGLKLLDRHHFRTQKKASTMKLLYQNNNAQEKFDELILHSTLITDLNKDEALQSIPVEKLISSRVNINNE